MSANSSITLIDFCNQNKIPYFYLNITYYTTPDGNVKKNVGSLPTGYLKMSYVEAMASHKPANSTHINIILRNSPKQIVVVDTDSEMAYQIITTNPEVNNTAVVKNRNRLGHAHFYYEVDKMPKKKIIKTEDGQPIDLIIDNIFERIDATFDKPLTYINLHKIIKIFKPSTSTNDDTIQPIIPTATSSTHENTNPVLTLTANTNTDTNIDISESETELVANVELVARMVNGLNSKEFEQYGEWIKLAYCLYNLAEQDLVNKHKYYEILDNFLKDCRNYNQGQNHYFFYTQIHMPIPDDKKIKIGSLYRWLKIQNKKLYDELFTINDPVRGDIDAVYFYTKYKNNYSAAKQYFEQVYFKLNNPACFCRYNNIDDKYTFITEKDLQHITDNFWLNDPDNQGKRIKFLHCWKNDMAIKTYSTIKLVPPPLVCDTRTLNLFTGFVADKLTNYVSTDITTILNHITLLCEDNAVYAEYVINFLAHLVQRPAELTRTALVFKGAQGAGKGLFFNWFANKIIGAQYYYSTSEPQNITLYNEHLNGKLLINLDEARAADTYGNSSQLKNKITEPRITLTNKYVKPFEVENYGRYIFFSNQDNPVKIEDTDRRYVIFKTSDKYSKLTPDDPVKINYFSDLRTAMDNPNIIGSFMKYLRDRDISQVNWENRPMTESYNLSRELNIPIFAEFIEKYCFETDTIQFTNNLVRTTKSQFFSEFNKFLDRTRNSGMTMKERTFSAECKKHKFIVYKQHHTDRSRYIEINRILAFEYLKNNRFLLHPIEEYNIFN